MIPIFLVRSKGYALGMRFIPLCPETTGRLHSIYIRYTIASFAVKVFLDVRDCPEIVGDKKTTADKLL
jgi:hypothetical protein